MALASPAFKLSATEGVGKSHGQNVDLAISQVPLYSAPRALRMYLAWSLGSTPRRGQVAPSSKGQGW